MPTKIPVVLHTYDNQSVYKFAKKHFTLLGLAVDSFSSNELAFAAAKEKTPHGSPPYYTAVIADYDTQSNMSGGQLIASLVKSKVDGNQLVDEILIISSSADRSGILKGLEKAFEEKGIQLDQENMPVQIYDKTTEDKLAKRR